MRFLNLILGFFMFFGSLQAQQSMSLKECVAYALSNHANVTKAQLDAEVAKYNVKEMLGVAFPQINGQLDMNYYVKIPTSLIPAKAFGGPEGQFLAVQFGVPWNSTAQISVNQLIFDGSYFLGLEASKMYVNLMNKEVSRTQQDISANVARAYYSVLISTKRVDILKENIAQLEKILANTQQLYKNGVVEKLDVDRLEVNLNNLKTELSKANEFIALGRNLLKYQMGMDLATDLQLTDPLQEKLEISLDDTSKTDFESKRVEFELMKMRIELQEKNIKRYRVMRYPSLYAFGNVQTQAQRQEFNFFDTKQRWYPISIVGIRLSVPIFDGLRTHNKIQAEKAVLKKYQLENSELKRGIALEFANAKTNLINNITDLEIHKRNISLAEQVYKIAQEKYQKGVGSNIEVIQAESSLKQAQTNYLNELLESYSSLVDLKKANGTLSEMIEKK